ncbi:MAG TPA: Holliday junction resolvase RuvX [Ktedonobacteraceae bacterium]|jgi:putative Holliday junction resolvase|nr:Holliday junction resolvase RuvX [Ktedonobacteraceae bacterium]
MARYMALDVGEVRIGVAVSDATGFLASPYTTLHASRDERRTWAAIEQLIKETGAEGLVVGLPISLDGQLHAQGERVRAFARRLQAHIATPLILWDERFSTVEAQRLLAERGQQEEWGKQRGRAGRRRTQSRRRGAQEIDAMAAAVILQDYLDHLGSTTGEKK